MTREQAELEAKRLNKKARKQGKAKKYLVIETCTMGVVVAERHIY